MRLATLVFLSIVASLACGSEVIVVTATPGTEPTPIPTVAPVVVPTTDIATPTPEGGITAAGVTLYPATPTSIPRQAAISTPSPIPIRVTPIPAPISPTQLSTPAPTPELPPEATLGVDALIACLGGDRQYWLAQGPPPITDALAECLYQKMGGAQ